MRLCKNYFFIGIAVFSFITLNGLGVLNAFADMTVESVYPTNGFVGEKIKITFTGTGFNENTRLYMFLKEGDQKALLKTIPTTSSSEGVTVSGTYLFISDGDNGVKIYDVKNPSHPKELSIYNTPGYAYSVSLNNKFAYIADCDDLQIIDISNLNEPTFAGQFIESCNPWGVNVLSDDKILITDGENGLKLINVKNPDEPTLKDQWYKCTRTDYTAIESNIAFAATSCGLQCLDINIQTNQISYLNSTLDDKAISGIDVNNQIAYAVDRQSLYIIDVSPLPDDKPEEIFSIETGDSVGVFVSDNTAFIANGLDGLLIIDIHNPQRPVKIWSFNTENLNDNTHGWEVAILNNYVALADGGEGVHIIQKPIYAFPDEIVNDNEISFSIVNPEIAGDYAFTLINDNEDIFLTDQISIVPYLSISPASYNFYTLDIYDSYTITVTLNSYTEVSLNSIYLTGNNHSEFIIQKEFNELMLYPNDTCSFQIIFFPKLLGIKHSTVNINIKTNNQKSSVIEMPIIGFGYEKMYLETEPDFDFLLGQNVTLNGKGFGDQITVSLEKGFFSTNLVLSENTNSKISFRIPENIKTGIYNLTIDNGIEHLNYECTILPHYSITPESYNFGKIDVNESDTLIVSFKSYTEVSIRSASLTGNDLTEFIVQHDCNELSLFSNDTCSLSVTFSPKFLGIKQSDLIIETNDDLFPVIEFPLTGIGYQQMYLETVQNFNFFLGQNITLYGSGFGNQVTVSLEKKFIHKNLVLSEQSNEKICFTIPEGIETGTYMLIIDNGIEKLNYSCNVFHYYSLTPDTFYYGKIDINESDSLIVSFNCYTEVSINSISLTGSDQSAFFIHHDCNELNLFSNNSCSLTVSFFPKSLGIKKSILKMETNNQNFPTIEMPLMGIGYQKNILDNEEPLFEFAYKLPTTHSFYNFENLVDIATDKKIIYLLDKKLKSVFKYSDDGFLISSWKLGNSIDIQEPDSIAIDNNIIYIFADKSIYMYTLNGSYIKKLLEVEDLEQLSMNADIALDRGYIYVYDYTCIWKYTSTGKYISKNEMDDIMSICYPPTIDIDSSGNIYVNDRLNNVILKYSSDLIYHSKCNINPVYGFTLDNNKLYINSGDGLSICSDISGSISKCEEHHNFYPYIFDESIQTDTFQRTNMTLSNSYIFQNNLQCDYSGTMNNPEINKFTQKGHLVENWHPPFSMIFNFNKNSAIACDDKYIYVVDTGNNRIIKYTLNGIFSDMWGKIGDCHNEYNYPIGIAVDNDYVYIADNKNNRIQIIDKMNKEYIFSFNVYSPIDIEVDKNGLIYVLGYNGLQLFNVNGELIKSFSIYGKGIALDRQGYIYLTKDTKKQKHDLVQKIDLDGNIINTWGEYGSEDGQFSWLNGITCDEYGLIYITDSYHPLPPPIAPGDKPWPENNRIHVFTTEGEFITSFDIDIYGPWDICVSKDGAIFVVQERNNIVKFNKNSETLIESKAIIVAGGGPYPGNDLWNATQISTEFAYHTLQSQGFSYNEISVLRPDIDNTYINWFGNWTLRNKASNDNLKKYINSWSIVDNTKRLIIYMVDHGGQENFRMNESEILYASNTEFLTSSSLDTWLDKIQLDGNIDEVIVVYDACRSGSFISSLTPPEGKKRIVITSTMPEENAYFITQGTISFSKHFWNSIFGGLDLLQAFKNASDAMRPFQTPCLDANGDGKVNTEEDLQLVSDIYLGDGMNFYNDAPIIENVYTDQVNEESSSAAIYANNATDDDGVARVWALIKPPDFHMVQTDSSVIDFPSIELLPGNGNNYTGIYDGFTTSGTYTISIYSRDRNGNISKPKMLEVNVGESFSQKCIIISGGTQSSSAWPSIKNNIKLAYDALSFQGYSDETIRIIIPPGPTIVDIGAYMYELSLDMIRDHIISWASYHTKDLIVYLIDEGYHENFMINDTETLSPHLLDIWLDKLQNNEFFHGKVTVIYDGNCSGHFINELIPPEEKERILISSTKDMRPSYSLSNGNISFSNFFWTRILNGSNVRDAFEHAKKSMFFSCYSQIPQLDDNGNGVSNESADGNLARQYKPGSGIMLGDDAPLIHSIIEDQTIGSNNGVIWVKDVTSTGHIEEITAVITPPCQHYWDIPEQDFPVVTLYWNEANQRFEGNYENFDVYGEYNISVYAKDNNNVISVPAETSLTCAATVPDAYEFDDTMEEANVIAMSTQHPPSIPGYIWYQSHNFHDQDDVDWVKFYGFKDETYKVKVKAIGENCKPKIEIQYEENLISQEAIISSGYTEIYIEFTCRQEASCNDGIYYVKISQTNNHYGEETAYELELTQPSATMNGLIYGTVSPPEIDTIITTSCQENKSAALLFENGSYFLPHLAGNFTLIATAENYKPFTKMFHLDVEENLEINIRFIPDALPPIAEFSINEYNCDDPMTTHFNDQSQGDLTFFYMSFGDGYFAYTNSQLTHTYNEEGTYIAEMILKCPGGQSSYTKTIDIYSPVHADFLFSEFTGVAPMEVAFTSISTGAAVTSLIWDFGDGSTVKGISNPTHTYTSAGEYTATLEVKGHKCIDIKRIKVTVYSKTICDFTASPTKGLSIVTVSVINNSSGDLLSFSWDFGDGYTCTHKNPTDHTYANPGEYTISLIVRGKGGCSICRQMISVYQQSDFKLIASTKEGTNPLTVEFSYKSIDKPNSVEWNFDDGYIVQESQRIEHTFIHSNNAKKDYNIKLILLFSWGNLEIEEHITVYPKTKCAFDISQEKDSSLMLIFTDQSEGVLTDWLWDFGDGYTSTKPETSHEYALPGAYHTTLTVKGYGGESTCYKTIGRDTEPFAKFTTNTINGIAPLHVNFSDISIGEVTERSWDFGDGYTATGQNFQLFTHLYNDPGNYTSTLFISGTGGEDSYHMIITVYVPPPTADFVAIPLIGEAPLDVSFTNKSSGNNIEFLWNFGDGLTNQTELNPIHEYIEPGKYTVTLNVNDPGGQDSINQLILVYPRTVASFSTSLTYGVAPLSVQFIDTSQGVLNEWGWNFGNGEILSQQNPLDQTYTYPGEYTVTLFVQGVQYNDTSSKQIIVCEKLIPDFVLSASKGLSPLSITCTDNSKGNVSSYQWFFNDDFISNGKNTEHLFDKAGVYQAKLVVEGDCDQIEKTNKIITVYDPPHADFIISNVKGTIPFAVQLTSTSSGYYTSCVWNFGDGITETEINNPIHTYTSVGEYTITLSISAFEKEESKSIHITICNPIILDFNIQQIADNTQTIQFKNMSEGDQISSWLWNFGDNTGNSQEKDPTHTFTEPKEYTVSLTADGTCEKLSIDKTFIVYSKSIAAFNVSSAEGLSEVTVQLSNNSKGYSLSWFWNFGDGYTSTIQNPPDHTYENPGQYTITLTIRGIAGSDSSNQCINVYKQSDFKIIASKTEGTDPFTVKFLCQSIVKADSLEWRFGDGTIVKDLEQTEHVYRNDKNTTQEFITTLTLWFSWGKVEVNRSIMVHPETKCNFSIVKISESPLILEFENNSEGELTGWLWNFGDGFTSAETNPTHEYIEPGEYTTSLAVIGTGGNSTCQNIIGKDIHPFARFSVNTHYGVAPLKVIFSDMSIGEIAERVWSFGDGYTVSGQHIQTYTHTYITPGDYTTTLLVSSIGGKDTYSSMITVHYPPPIVNFEPTPISGEVPLTVTFQNNSSGNHMKFFWDFGDGSTNQTHFNPAHQYIEPGNYTVVLNISDDGGSDTQQKSIQVYPSTVAYFTAYPLIGVAPLSIKFLDESTGHIGQWNWNFGDDQQYLESNPPEHYYKTPGNYTVTLFVTGTDTSDAHSINITVCEKLIPDFTVSTTEGLAPLSITCTDQSKGNVSSYHWIFEDQLKTFDKYASYIFEGPGQYPIELTVTGDCDQISKTQKIINVYDPPHSSFIISNTKGTIPFAIQLTNTSSGYYTSSLWDFGDGNTVIDTSNPIHTYTSAGEYTVTLITEAFGKQNKKEVLLSVCDPIIADFNILQLTDNTLSIKFSNITKGNEILSWFWNFGDNTSISNEKSPMHTYSLSGEYTVTLTANGFCEKNSITKTIFVYPKTVADFTA